MTKNDLEEYQRRTQLIAAYQAELDGGMETADSVTGSMHEHPYVERHVTIRGLDIKRAQCLQQRIYELSEQCTRVEAFIAGVEDEHMRALLYWHYIQGLSWPKVRRALRIRNLTADYLRKKTNMFLKCY